MILPPVGSLNPDQLPLVKQSIYMQWDTKFSELKERLFRILKDQFNLTDVSQLRIWKTNFNFTKPEHIRDFLKDKQIGGPSTAFVENDPSMPEIDMNTGVDFPGL